MKCLIIRPGKRPEKADIPNDLASLQEVVGGNIDVLGLYMDTVMIVNKEGNINGYKPNRILRDNMMNMIDVICGNIIITGMVGGQYCDIPERSERRYMEIFKGITVQLDGGTLRQP